MLPETVNGLFGHEIHQISDAITDPNYPPPLRDQMPPSDNFDNYLGRWRMELINKVGAFIEKIASKAYTYSADQVRQSIIPDIQYTKDQHLRYMDETKTISNRIMSISDQHDRLSRELKRNISLAKAESVVSGWQIPTAMIVISVSHFFGIYFPVLPNALYLLDKLGIL